MISRLTVLYDADCGICTHTARALARLDSNRRLNLIALQTAAIPGQPSREVLLDVLHAVDAEGRWSSGGAASVEIARRLPALRPLSAVARLPLAMPILDAVYRFTANHRQQLSRLLGLQACKVRSRVS